MTQVPIFDPGTIESLAKLLGESNTGSEIDRFLDQTGMEDNSGVSTKWRRLNWMFNDTQRRYQCANKIIEFISISLAPTRYFDKNDEFESIRADLNVILAMSGLEYGADGKFRKGKVAQTIAEAEERVQKIRAKFRGRRLHREVLKYCDAELMQENYFHAVFEATKGLAERVRELSDKDLDGAQLVEQVFMGETPILAFNTLQTDTERSEHRGFAFLMKGCFAAIRNPLAHEPKILWDGEDDAADYFTLISLLHRRLDNCVKTSF